jgi:AraC-like DNA-binding protein
MDGHSQARGHFDTRGFAPADAGEGVRTALSRVHLPWTLTACRPEPFGVRLAWSALGGATLVDYRGAPCAGHRRAAEIRRTEGAIAGLLLVVSGREHVRQGEGAVTLSAGDLFLWDSTRPIDFHVPTPLHKVTLLLPRERLVRALERGCGAPPWGRIATDGGPGALLSAHLAALSRHGGTLEAGAAAAAAAYALDLLAGTAAPPAATGAAALRERAVALIARHFDDPSLTPTRLAGLLAVSPRYLHMAFAASGDTVAGRIRARRLQRLARDLADAGLAARSITALALSAGFDDAAHASRAFRHATGQSPSAFRAAALGRQTVDEAGEAG